MPNFLSMINNCNQLFGKVLDIAFTFKNLKIGVQKDSIEVGHKKKKECALGPGR